MSSEVGSASGGGRAEDNSSVEVAASPLQGGNLQPQPKSDEHIKSNGRSGSQVGKTGPQSDFVENATVDELNAEIGGEVKHILRAKQYHESLQAKKKSLQLKVR